MLLAAVMHRLSFSFLVLALASLLAACSSVEIDTPDIRSGTVTNHSGDAMSGVRVAVGEAVATTDVAGHFEVSTVAGPYDVTLFEPMRNIAYVYVGLTDQDHTFRIDGTGTNPLANDHSVSFTVKFPEKDSDSLRSTFDVEILDEVTEQSFDRDLSEQPTAQERTIDAHWRGTPTVKARVQAFHIAVDPASRAIQHYVGYDSFEVSVTDGVPAVAAVSWKPPPFGEATISVTAKLSNPQLFLYGTDVELQSSVGYSRLGSGAIKGSELSFVVPDILGARFNVSIDSGDKSYTSAGSGSYATARLPGLVAGAKGAVIDVEPAPFLVSPPDGGAFGAGTELEWSVEGDGASLVLLSPMDQDAGAINYFVATAGNTTVVPDLSRLGVKLPQGLKYGWIVFRNSLTPTVEDIAAEFVKRYSETEPTSVGNSPRWTLTSQ